MTQVRLTQRGKFVLGIILFILTILVIGLINVNVLTPQQCRDGVFDIKKTEQCHKHRIGF